MKMLRRIWKGAHYLEGYGEHPGTLAFFAFVLMCGLAGAKRGSLAGFFGGMAVGLIFFGPLYAMGCYDRAKMYEQDVEATMKRLKKDYNGN